MTETIQGVVLWFHISRGYGFIGRDAAEDVFVHYSALEVAKALRSGQLVEFVLAQSSKGLQATKVSCV